MPSITITAGVTDAIGTHFNATAIATATASSTINVGETTILTATDNGNGNLLVAQPVVLAQPATLQSLSFYVNPVGGQLRLGLYSGTTAPTSLVGQTAAFTPAVGWNTQPASSALLQAGNYWLAYLPQSNTLGFRKADTGGTSRFLTQAFGAMPATFPAGANSTPSHWSFYGTFGVGPPPPPDTTPPSTPTGVTATEI